MSIATLILGESGTGKTASLRNLDPAKTLLIQTIKKPLPFRAAGWKPYARSPDGTVTKGNVIVTDKAATIERALRTTVQPIVVIDDWQYMLANEYMRRSDEKGYDKFSDIARHAWDVLIAATSLAAHRRVYILTHSTTDDLGHTKTKTIGKLLDEKVTVEGMFSIVLRTHVIDGQYQFSTQNNGLDTVKSPMGLFAERLIDNDLAAVDAAICDYYGIADDAPQAHTHTDIQESPEDASQASAPQQARSPTPGRGRIRQGAPVAMVAMATQR